jgi:sphingolipid delta-4 desaturase
MPSTISTKLQTGHDAFLWTYTEEPHRSRRQAIIKAHPEVLKLCGPEPLTKYIIAGVVLLQICCACLLRQTNPLSWKFFATAYVVGATANQNLFLGIHELSHNLVFKAGWMNRLFAVFANLPIVLPYTAVFRVSSEFWQIMRVMVSLLKNYCLFLFLSL